MRNHAHRLLQEEGQAKTGQRLEPHTRPKPKPLMRALRPSLCGAPLPHLTCAPRLRQASADMRCSARPWLASLRVRAALLAGSARAVRAAHSRMPV